MKARSGGGLVEADLVDCIVAMPDKLFLNTGIPVCLWFVAKDRANDAFRSRRGEILFIDARKLGKMVNRTLRVLDVGDVSRVASTYHAWRGEQPSEPYADIPGFCYSATISEVAAHGFVLVAGRYVGAVDVENDEPIDERLAQSRFQLLAELDESARLQRVIRERLRTLLS